MEYKGYIGQFAYDEDIDRFEGKVSNVKDIILFHGKSIESLHFAFQDAINEYLSWCKKIGKEPEKPFSLPTIYDIKPYPLLKRIPGAFRHNLHLKGFYARGHQAQRSFEERISAHPIG